MFGDGYQTALLTDNDVQPLADAVLELLERVGLVCQNDELLRALEATGAKVDSEAQRATFPKSMARQFVERVRKEAADRSPEGDAGFPKLDRPTVTTQVAQFAYDARTGQKRPGNRPDMIELAKLGEMLHGERGVGHALTLTDEPAAVEPLETGLLLAEYCSKPEAPFAADLRQVDYLIEMGEILGLENWYQLGAVCFAHPLRFAKTSADKFVRRMADGGKAAIVNMAVAGVSTPVTLEGFIVTTAAEFLALWMTGRAMRPDVELGGSLWGGTADMRSGQVSFCAFDAMLYSFTVSEFLRRWTGELILVGGGEYCDATVPGLFATWEKAYKSMTIAAFSGYHPGPGYGMLECGRTMCAAQLVLDGEFMAGLGHYARKVESKADKIALETIIDSCLTGQSLLDADHTATHFRNCLYLPALFNRTGYTGAGDDAAIVKKAQDKVDALIGEYRKPEIDPDKLAEMREVIERAEKQLV